MSGATYVYVQCINKILTTDNHEMFCNLDNKWLNFDRLQIENKKYVSAKVITIFPKNVLPKLDEGSML
jgi:hypothetical protein